MRRSFYPDVGTRHARTLVTPELASFTGPTDSPAASTATHTVTWLTSPHPRK